MRRTFHRNHLLAALVGVLLGLVACRTPAATTPASRLDQIESLRTKDHPRFVRMLQQFHRQAALLSTAEQWHLRYLDAWQTAYEGNYTQADVALRDIISHAGNPALVAKSSARLMDDLSINRRYEEAFEVANQLVVELPGISDKLARFIVLANLSQVLGGAGQYDLAVDYARQMETSLPAGESLCASRAMQMTALFNGKKLTSASPQLRQATALCSAAGQPVFAETLWLVLANLYLDEGQPRKAATLLERITPGIGANQFHMHIESAGIMLAQAYWRLGNIDKAHDLAAAAVALAGTDEISETLRDGYGVLYQVAKRRGDLAAALSFYEHYVAQDKGYLNDLSARALAYQMAQQRVLAGKLQTAELARQNDALRLQQALDTRTVEASRLYIALLLLALASIVLWLFRLKRSQLRFRDMARHDSLTGILNHQHFINDAERLLSALQRKPGDACLVSIDLDHFKQVNDNHGHAMGDAVLKHAVEICQRHLRPGDLFGRLGGEEFGILLHDCSREQGLAIADRIRTAIATSPLRKDGHAVNVSASIGLACTHASGHQLLRLCAEADAALYSAKRGGRNRVSAGHDHDRGVEA